MGIKNLMQLIKEQAPSAIKNYNISYYMGRTIACDASMAMYQFLIMTLQQKNQYVQELTDTDGNPTGHLIGLWNRTIQFFENGIKPIWVFDGKPPQMKGKTLQHRQKVKEEAAQKLETAVEEGDVEEQKKQMQRSIRITKEMVNDAKHMLELTGAAVVQAPGEAEAQCAAYVKEGKAYATASEDLDTITFASDFLLRGFNNKKEPIQQISYKEVIDSLKLSHDEFVDMCILCGCDYTTTIDGIGVKTAYKLIKENGTIESVIEELNEKNKNKNKKKKFIIPEDFMYQQAREMFLNPDVDPLIPIEFKVCQAEQLESFLVGQRQFNIDRTKKGIKALQDSYTKPKQSKLESFFKPIVQQSGKRKLEGKSNQPLKKMKVEGNKKNKNK